MNGRQDRSTAWGWRHLLATGSLVAIAVLAGAAESIRTFKFIGPREMVKFQSAQAAMNMLRLLIEDGSPLHRN